MLQPARARGLTWVIAVALVVIAVCLVMLVDRRSVAHAQSVSHAGARGVFAFTGQLTKSTYGVFLVDDQFAPLTEKIKAAIAKVSDHPVKFVVNTHHHGDHVGGNENFGTSGSVIVAHANVRKRMSTEQFMETFGARTPPYPKAALPVITFEESVTFHLNGEEIHVQHVPPAHSDTDSFVHFKTSNVLHMGDCYFAGRYAFFDISSGGNIDGMIQAAGRGIALADEDTKIIPGHGPLSNRKELVAYRDMLVKARDAVQKLVDAGKSLKETLEAKPTADLDAEWGQAPFPKAKLFVTLVYTSLKEKSD